MFLGIIHFITATRFHMDYVRQLEGGLQGAAIRGCSYLAKQYIKYAVDINVPHVRHTVEKLLMM